MENPKEEELARLCRKEDGNRETNKRQKEWTEGQLQKQKFQRKGKRAWWGVPPLEQFSRGKNRAKDTDRPFLHAQPMKAIHTFTVVRNKNLESSLETMS